MLEGRGGADRFVYDQHGTTARPAAPDRILDFSRKQGDRIDLSGVDANEQAAGDQAFQFIGQSAVHGRRPGPLLQGRTATRWSRSTPTTRRAGAEMRIEIDPLVNLQATDFVL